jgi:nucleolar MIF4G domain-containing protein 1
LQEDGVVAGGGSSFESGFDEDEQYIRHYEKKLGLKRKDVEKLGSKKSFMDDGLGDILQGIELGSRGIRPKSTTTRKESGQHPDDSFSKSRSLSSAGKKRSALEAESEDDDSDMDDSEEEDDMDSFDEELEGIDPEDMADSDMDDMEDDMEGFDGESDDGDSGPESEDDESEDPEDLKDLEDDDLSEDNSSSGEDTQLDKATERTRDATTAQTGKYIPPHLRAAAEAAATAEGGASALAKAIPRKNTEELLRLRRQLQGLLNKLSESNIESILMEIEGVYRQYPRAGRVFTAILSRVGWYEFNHH